MLNLNFDGDEVKPVFPENFEYEICRKDVLIFRLPKDPGFFLMKTEAGYM